jgi:acyl-CoA thioesterase II
MSQQSEPTTVAELLSVRALSPTSFISNFNPQPMGSLQPRAYGGCTLGVAISSAYAAGVQPHFHPYSILGHFLGPAQTDRPLYVDVERLRDTRTFLTLQIRVTQEQDGGKGRRSCMSLVADFQAAEKKVFEPMVFSAKPERNWGPPSEGLTWVEHATRLRDEGYVSDKFVKGGPKGFGLGKKFFDSRHLPQSPMGRRLYGVIKKADTEEDKLPLTDMVSSDWVRIAHPLKGENEHVAAIACILDGAMSFIPLTHTHRFLDDVGASGSLDFALRFFTNDININEWKLRELKAIVGAEARTYNEAKLYSEDGKLIAIMNQQGIMRPKEEVKGKI